MKTIENFIKKALLGCFWL